MFTTCSFTRRNRLKILHKVQEKYGKETKKTITPYILLEQVDFHIIHTKHIKHK